METHKEIKFTISGTHTFSFKGEVVDVTFYHTGDDFALSFGALIPLRDFIRVSGKSRVDENFVVEINKEVFLETLSLLRKDANPMEKALFAWSTLVSIKVNVDRANETLVKTNGFTTPMSFERCLERYRVVTQYLSFVNDSVMDKARKRRLTESETVELFEAELKLSKTKRYKEQIDLEMEARLL